ncbi:MAG TPA: MBL fold metallo-hydrolase, partial [Ramlibacter sp.]|nr:MBL fold metallo-hydrolase [Ramlibacter sp.]
GVAAALVLVGLSACAVLQHPTFGKLPEGARMAAIQASPNYRDGAFQNAITTPTSTDGTPFAVAVVRGLFEPRLPTIRPATALPAVKTDLRSLPADQDTVVWLGHSSYYVQLGGRRILVDPVLSGNAAPFPGMVKAFDGTTIYTVADMPEIDYLLITHDHYDHLDHPTIRALVPKTRWAVAGLGIGAHLEHWGFPADRIREGDWFDAFRIDPELAVHVLPARHYSGRTFRRNQALWVGFALEANGRRLFFGGDSGFGPHLAEIASRFDGFDLAVLDAGQYNARWANIHMNPEEAAQAAEILGAKALLPAHVGRFALARHAWDEPFDRVLAASRGRTYRLLTPRIGEPVRLGSKQQFDAWWKPLGDPDPR